MNKNTILIGVGNSGCKILSKANLKAETLYINTDKEDVEKYSGLCIGMDNCKGLPTCGDMLYGELAAEESKSQILEELDKFSNCIIIAPMGGGTSCGATKKIVEFALKNNITVTVITSMPFKKEGILRIRRSTETLTYLKNLCKVIEIKIEPIDFYETLNLNIVFNIMDSKFIEVIKKL